MQKMVIMLGAIFLTTNASAQDIVCHFNAICVQTSACQDVGPFDLELTQTETGFSFETGAGVIQATHVDPENEDLMMLFIPFQYGNWGTFSIYQNGIGVLSMSGLQNNYPYSTRAFALCEMTE
ncbi:MAG: hypothetical protein JKY31_11160 [Rhodobacteraceae bacterium]|nr:hypothetical protein [Paracoccaceae bacterium]